MVQWTSCLFSKKKSKTNGARIMYFNTMGVQTPRETTNKMERQLMELEKVSRNHI